MATKLVAKTTPMAPNAVVTDSEEFHAWKHPRYLSAQSKLHELKAKREAIDREIQHGYRQIEDRKKYSRRELEAHSLVHGGELPEEEPMKDMERLRHDLAVHTEAVVVAERNLSWVENEVSRDICDRVRPHFLEMTRRLYSQARALDAVRSEYRRFISGLEDNGTHMINLPLIGSVSPGEMEDLARAHGIDLES